MIWDFRILAAVGSQITTGQEKKTSISNQAQMSHLYHHHITCIQHTWERGRACAHTQTHTHYKGRGFGKDKS